MSEGWLTAGRGWLRRLHLARQSTVGRNTLWNLLGQGGRTLIQAAYFVVSARALGVSAYGGYVAAAALASIMAPFAGCGFNVIMLQQVARDPGRLAPEWGRAIAVVGISGLALSGLAVGLARFVLPREIPTLLLVCVALSDLIFLRLNDTTAQLYEALQRLDRSALIQTLNSLGRLIGAVLLFVFAPRGDAALWGVLLLAGTAAATAAGMALTVRELGRPEFRFKVSLSDIRYGLYFSVGISAQSIYNDIDKTMLSRYGSLPAAGLYGVAYRLIDVTVTPIKSLIYATMANFFRRGVEGIGSTVAYARRMVPAAAGYAVAAAIGLTLFSPLMGPILGPDYAQAAEALRWLALLPLLKAFHFFAASALTGAGRQGLRSLAQVAVAVANILLNLWLIPAYSWRGAAVASLLSDGLLALILWTMVWQLTTRPLSPLAVPKGES